MTESDQSDVFLDGISSVRPVADIGEIPYLQLIHSVSFFLLCFLGLKLLTVWWQHF